MHIVIIKVMEAIKGGGTVYIFSVFLGISDKKSVN